VSLLMQAADLGEDLPMADDATTVADGAPGPQFVALSTVDE